MANKSGVAFSLLFRLCKLQSAMITLKNNTSSGLDRLSNEMLKHSTPRQQDCICKLFNIINNNERYPSLLRENLLKHIHIRGNDADPKISGVLYSQAVLVN